MSDDSLLDIWGMRKRGKRDSARHTKRVKKAIKDNLKEIGIAEKFTIIDDKEQSYILQKFLNIESKNVKSILAKHSAKKFKQLLNKGKYENNNL